MRKTKLTALLLGGVIAASALAGCGSIDKNEVAAVFDGQEITLGLPNFAARLQQAQDDDLYAYYFGGSVWESDLTGTGVTAEEEVKNTVMDNLFAMYTLEAHMEEYGVELSGQEQEKIDDAAASFLASNSKEALDELGADKEIVQEYLRLLTIQRKMHQAIIADVDTNVSDEEANTSAYSYVRVSKTTYTDEEGKSVEYTDEELKELAKTVESFAAEAKESSLEDAAKAHSYTVSKGTFTADDEILDEAVLTALKSLEEGASSDVIDTENAYYVVRLDAKTDQAATEAAKAGIISERQTKLYEDTLSGWQESHTWEVKKSVWKKVKFDRGFTTIEPVTEETEPVTEQAEATEQ